MGMSNYNKFIKALQLSGIAKIEGIEFTCNSKESEFIISAPSLINKDIKETLEVNPYFYTVKELTDVLRKKFTN